MCLYIVIPGLLHALFSYILRIRNYGVSWLERLMKIDRKILKGWTVCQEYALM